jgi:hypothetical protein
MIVFSTANSLSNSMTLSFYIINKLLTNGHTYFIEKFLS